MKCCCRPENIVWGRSWHVSFWGQPVVFLHDTEWERERVKNIVWGQPALFLLATEREIES